ncbi:MAG TPA: TolC family protein, partial [Elusimicrobiota bacterium]|nr:TolC family protein [Elusimicrobiota bacterium]
MIRRVAVAACLFLAAGSRLCAEPGRIELSLADALDASLTHSDQWASARSVAEAAADQALVQRATQWPHLALAGSYAYVAEIPTLQISPQAPAIAFTTHNQYSIGPTISWTAFSGGALRESWKAAEAYAQAQSGQADAIRRQIRLASRLDYFQAQLATAQVRLYAESYRVEQAQVHDIRVRTEAGEAARIDLLAEEQIVLQRQRQLLEARSTLAAAVRDLASLTHRFET